MAPYAYDADALFRAHNDVLVARVRAAVQVPHATVEEACQFAWLQLLRCPPAEGHTNVVAWLIVVARREALRLAQHDGRALPVDLNGSETAVAAAAPRSLSEQYELRERAHDTLAAVAQLPERRRRLLLLRAAGYSYHEIERLTGEDQKSIDRQTRRARNALEGRPIKGSRRSSPAGAARTYPAEAGATAAASKGRRPARPEAVGRAA